MKGYQYHIFSPYRVCPIGAHVDHQHGLVTGFAINKGVDLWFNVREAMPDFEIGIFFSGLTRSLANSDYNLRVYECKTAAWNMLAYKESPLKPFPKTFLRDVPRSIYEATRDLMPARFV
jgi:galactokinase